MKKLLLLAIAMQTLYAYGQIEKKRWIGTLTLSGLNYQSKNVSGGANLNGKGTIDNFSTQLSIGQMISNKWLLGIAVDYSYKYYSNYNYQVPANTNSQTTNSYGFLVLGNYFSAVANNLFFGSNYSAGYSFGRIRDAGLTYSEYFQNEKKYSLNAEPIGIAYLFKKRYLLRLSLFKITYNYSKQENTLLSNGYNDSSNRLEYSFNPLQNGISFSYIFKNKKDAKL